MRIALFSTHTFDREFFNAANGPHGHELIYLEARLSPATAALPVGSGTSAT